MADSQIKYISLDNITLYDQLIKGYINSQDANALKTVMLSSDNKSLLFYRSMEPISEGAVPDYSITIPETNLDGCMKRVLNALQGNVPVFNNNGAVVDGGIALSDLVTEEEAQQMITEAIENSSRLIKTIVDDIADVTNPAANVIYLVKDASVTGEDKYREYTLIDGVLTLIGSTSTDLSQYITSDQINALIAAAKQQAIDAAAADATSKTNQALADAKAYTDQEIQKEDQKVSALGTRVTTVEGDITTINNTLNSHNDRITALESGISEMQVATEADIRALFPEQNVTP